MSEGIVGNDGEAIVGKMHNDRYPQTAGPKEDITEHRTHQHARDEAEELHMDGGEDDCRDPNGNRPLRCKTAYAVRPFHCKTVLRTVGQNLLESATEGEFFREGGEKGHEADVNKQAAEVISLQEAFGEDSSGFFHSAELLLECGESRRKDDTVIKVREEVDSRNSTNHDAYRDETEETVRLGIHTEPGEGTMIVRPDGGTEDRREEERSCRLGELKPFEGGGGLHIGDEEPCSHDEEGKDRHGGEPKDNLNKRILFHAAKVLQKLHICKFFTKLFAYMRKKLYLCTRKG